jgi:prophage regulatory protein
MTAAYNRIEADPFLRLPAVRELTGRSTAAIYRDMQAGKFPRPVALGPNARGWRLSEIAGWQAERLAARDSGADAPLRAVNPNIGKDRQRKQHAQSIA